MVDAQQTESTQAEVNERIDEVELEQRQNQKYEDSRSFNKNETIDAHANKVGNFIVLKCFINNNISIDVGFFDS
ncbi:unnamed protein product, partial [Rotaria magnacalcarata]